MKLENKVRTTCKCSKTIMIAINMYKAIFVKHYYKLL